MNEKEFLKKVQLFISQNDVTSLWDIINGNPNLELLNSQIEDLLFSLCPTQNSYADIHLTGQGGSKILKPNLTTLTAYYLGLCGFSVVKTGSTKHTSVSGSSDFVFKTADEYPYHWNCSKLKYYDIDYCSPWIKYRSILEQNSSFENFFAKNIFNECKTKLKFVGVLGPDALKIRKSKHIINPPDKEFAFFTEANGCYLDEIIPGSIYFDGELITKTTFSKYPNLTKSDVDIINEKLFLGLDNTSFWYNCLKLSVSHIIYFSSCKKTNLEVAENIFLDAYKFSKHLTLNNKL